MQPYFFPYLGYYRLISEVDTFVVLDCVQFPRRGWVHRNRFTSKNHSVDWITLPLIKGSRDGTKISNLMFRENSSEILRNQFQNFLVYDFMHTNTELCNIVFDTSGKLVDYLCRSMDYVIEKFNLPAKIVHSSDMNIPASLKGKDKIIHIVQSLKGNEYVNLSGGIDLYNSNDFLEHGINLKLLSPYLGPKISILERIIFEDAKTLLREIYATD